MPLVPTGKPAPRVTDPTVQYTMLVCSLMNQHGLTDWTFELDRAKRRAGCCKHGCKTLTLSYHYITRNLDKPDDIRDTILHEIAHALAGHDAGHGDAWKAICVRIGASPQRCYDSTVIDMPKGQLVATCQGCSKTFRRHRRVRSGTYRYCLTCGPDTGRLLFSTATGLIQGQ